MTHETRESWLNAVAQGMALLFEALDAPLPDRLRHVDRYLGPRPLAGLGSVSD